MTKKPNQIVHALRHGSALCNFQRGAPPGEWPEQHLWAPPGEAEADVNCVGCLVVMEICDLCGRTYDPRCRECLARAKAAADIFASGSIALEREATTRYLEKHIATTLEHFKGRSVEGPTKLELGKTLILPPRISAGALRRAGFEVDERVPDVAEIDSSMLEVTDVRVDEKTITLHATIGSKPETKFEWVAFNLRINKEEEK